MISTIIINCAQRAELNSATLRQLAILFMIHDHGSTTIKELGRVLNAPKPAMTRSADVLEDAGLVFRRINPIDRRVIILELTTKGTELVNSVLSTGATP